MYKLSIQKLPKEMTCFFVLFFRRPIVTNSVLRIMDVRSKTKPLAGGRKRKRDESTMEGDERRWRTVQEEPSHFSPESSNPAACEIFRTKSDTCTPSLKTRLRLQRKRQTFQRTLSKGFKDNSQYVQKGRALACFVERS